MRCCVSGGITFCEEASGIKIKGISRIRVAATLEIIIVQKVKGLVRKFSG